MGVGCGPVRVRPEWWETSEHPERVGEVFGWGEERLGARDLLRTRSGIKTGKNRHI